MSGDRLSLWIPESELWLVAVVDRLVALAAERGLVMSRSEIIREALRSAFHGMSVAADLESEVPVVPATGPVSTRLSMRISGRHRGLLDMVRRVVNAKRAIGIRSSVSSEILRLAHNGLVGGLAGSDFDRKVLCDVDEDSGSSS